MTQKKVPFKREFKNFKESLRTRLTGEYGLLPTAVNLAVASNFTSPWGCGSSS